MVDLGSMPGMYDHPTSSPEKPAKNYPRVTLPMTILKGKKFEIGDKVYLELTGCVKALRQDDWGNEISIELEEGDIESNEEENSETPASEKKE